MWYHTVGCVCDVLIWAHYVRRHRLAYCNSTVYYIHSYTFVLTQWLLCMYHNSMLYHLFNLFQFCCSRVPDLKVLSSLSSTQQQYSTYNMPQLPSKHGILGSKSLLKDSASSPLCVLSTMIFEWDYVILLLKEFTDILIADITTGQKNRCLAEIGPHTLYLLYMVANITVCI